MVKRLNNNEVRELVLKAKEGDEQAIEKIINNFNSCIWKIVHDSQSKALIRGIDLDDLYQEGLIGLYDAIKTYKDNEHTTFFTYMYLICQRKINHFMKSKNNIYYNENLISNFTINEEESVYNIAGKNYIEEDRLTIDLLYKAIDSLDELEKSIILLFLKGNSYKDICFKLNITTKQVDYRLRKSRKHIRIYIENIEENDLSAD